MGVYQLDSSNRRRNCLPVTLEWPGRARKTSALLDSGAEESFLDATVVAQWGVPLVEVSKPRVASSLNGQTTQDEDLGEPSGGDLPPDNQHPAFSGHAGPPVDGEAQVDWARHKILEWDPSCSSRCLQKAHAPVATPQREEAPNLAKVPREYHDL